MRFLDDYWKIIYKYSGYVVFIHNHQYFFPKTTLFEEHLSIYY